MQAEIDKNQISHMAVPLQKHVIAQIKLITRPIISNPLTQLNLISATYKRDINQTNT